MFSGGRLFVGAISFLYLLSKGIATEQIAIVKSIQIATFLIFDIPFGIFIKKVGHKFSLLVTFSVSIIGMVLYMCGNSISFFILAEFFLALSLCLSPTTFADYIMYFLKNNSGLSVERVFHRNEFYTNIANLLCGSIGGVLFTLSPVIPFIAAIFFQLLGFYLIFQTPSPTININSELTIINFVKNNFRFINIFNKNILIISLLFFSVQLTIQPLLQYWQPFFLEINPLLSGKFMGIVFAFYSSIVIFLNFLFSKFSETKFFRSLYFIFFILACAIIFYFITSKSNNLWISIISFCFLQGIMFVVMTCLSTMSNKVIKTADRPIILKAISFFSRIGTFISLFGIKIFFDNFTSSSKIHELYSYSAFILVVCTFSIFFFFYLINQPSLEMYKNEQ